LEKFLLVCEAVVPGRIGFEDQEYPQRDYLNAVLAATRDLNFATLLAEKGKGNAAEAVKNRRLQLVTDKVAELSASND
jgi:tRNA nucleotidyltransferase (CCA-adding enzyme)